MIAANGLTEADYRMFELSWITRQIADDAMIRRVSSSEGAELVCCKNSGNYAGLVFSYVWPVDTHVRDYRLRRDCPEMERKPDGSLREKRKYLSAPGGRNKLYFPCGIKPEALLDISLPIVIAEGEKKTLALYRLANWNSAESRFLPVGLSGVWNWRGTIGKEPGPNGEMRNVKGTISDMQHIEWKERTVYILFDSDKRSNTSVREAERAFAGELKSRGAVVRLIDLPDLPDLDKTGADDFLAHPDGGPERLLALIEVAKMAEPGSAGEILSRAGISELTAESGIDEVEAALRRLRREMNGVDNLRETAVRNETIKHLAAIGIQAPAQLVNAALARLEQQNETRGIAFPETEPWSHPVDGSLLLDEIAASLRRFVVLPSAEIQAITLWVVHTYAVEATSICPILIIKSAEKRSGKTLLLELLFNLVFRPLPASNITASSLFRVIERYKSTLLLDEAETYLCNNEELRGIINSGYRRSSSYVIRTVGDDYEPVVFNTFGPKAIAQIDKPQETILDRSVLINIRRKTPDEKPERLRSDRAFEDFKHLRQKALRWTKDHLKHLMDSEPQVPEELNDRARDSWRPLLAIAELAGSKWAGYGYASAVKLSAVKSEVSKRTLLLGDIRDIFQKAQVSRMASADICNMLIQVEEHPWVEWREGKPITVHQLARALEPLDIKPKQLKMGRLNIRGYEFDDFNDSFARYMPDLES